MTDQELCGAEHPDPSLGVTCGQAPGPNAVKEIPHDIPATATADEVAAILAQPAERVDVHVHSGRSADDGVHRWEDPPENDE